MLKTVDLSGKRKDLSEKRNGECVMLLGGFDGIHLGHRKLLERAKAHSALSGLPIGIMAIDGGKATENLFTVEEREDIFKRAGIDFVFELPFEEIRELSPQQFALLLMDFRPKIFICGNDFRFGYRAEGNAEILKRATHVSVDEENLLFIDGKKVSATRIKQLLSVGKTEEANGLLGGEGEEFFLIGKVVKDRQVGRTIGFPTANILYPSGKFPLRKGVYETRTEADGKIYKCITNYGARPTFDNGRELTETYLDGFEGDLYGKTLKIRFVRRLRGIEKFPSAEALKAQLGYDMERVRRGAENPQNNR